ncbi:MAG: metallophosphoesterase, partial [Tissierellia bacterium]|nr:metallophosphoesterase [Tissierellia bacterium]
MKSFKDVCKSLACKLNLPHMPEDLLNDIKGPVLLHISDTPSEIYPYIFKIIDILKPQYIFHTGDLADNVKLEINKDRIKGYCSLVKGLVEGLEKSDAKVYYFMGNHDDYEAVSKLSKKGTILEEGLITIGELNFRAGHYYKEYPYKADFNLFGHSFEPCHYKKGGTIGL